MGYLVLTLRPLQCFGFGSMFAFPFIGLFVAVRGHGRLVEPPSRSSMFRFGYPTPANYADNQLFCGGFQVQWGLNNGRCGVCGDPWDGPRENEAGGKYAKGIIVRRYKPSSVILVEVQITAPHKGWFEFRLCPNNNPHRPVTHECLDENVLELETGEGGRYYLEDNNPGMVSLGVRLPPALTCSQCVLQWKYNAGNSWGEDEWGHACVGCGPQEQFYGCADIAIGEEWENLDFDPSYYDWTRVHHSGAESLRDRTLLLVYSTLTSIVFILLTTT